MLRFGNTVYQNGYIFDLATVIDIQGRYITLQFWSDGEIIQYADDRLIVKV